MRTMTVYICLRPFEGEWKERNETVLRALAWQNVPGLKIVLVHWPDEASTIDYAREHGMSTLEVPFFSHYMFPKPVPSFKLMFEHALEQCDTDLFVYMNGDIVLGPGILEWLQAHASTDTMYSLPRHNWHYSGPLNSVEEFENADVSAEPWTALDLFCMNTADARRDIAPLPPFIMTAGSMDSWLVARAGDAGWNRCLLPVDRFRMLHIEHPASHPFKPGQDPERRTRWAFNCGVYAQAVSAMPETVRKDTSLACFSGAENCVAVQDTHCQNAKEESSMRGKPKYFVLDVDGVMTTGQFFYSENGKLYKVFGPHDSDGLKMLRDHLEIRFITADKRGFEISRKRIVEDMGYRLDLVSEETRMAFFETEVKAEETIFMGDGYHDVPALRNCMVGIAPANARKEAREAADFVTESRAGEGAVLDACLYIKDTYCEPR